MLSVQFKNILDSQSLQRNLNLEVCLIFLNFSNKIYTYESCVKKIIFFLTKHFCSLFILIVIIFITKN